MICKGRDTCRRQKRKTLKAAGVYRRHESAALLYHVPAALRRKDFYPFKVDTRLTRISRPVRVPGPLIQASCQVAKRRPGAVKSVKMHTTRHTVSIFLVTPAKAHACPRKFRKRAVAVKPIKEKDFSYVES